MHLKIQSLASACALGAGAVFLASGLALARPGQHRGRRIEHVLLISIDGMHALDYANCSKGIAGINSGGSYCPSLAQLGRTGVNYPDTTTSKPSDSFPGLMALVAGGTPRTVGAFYDVAYDRFLAPPAQTTGNGVAGGNCVPGTANGTTTEFDEGIDIDQTKLNGGASSGDGGISAIDPNKLVRDPGKNCAPVFPWNFVRTNTIFGVVHAAGGYTAWSDKHPSYSSVAGPGDGSTLNDYYSPEINSNLIPLPGVVTPEGFDCGTLKASSATWTDDFQAIRCYDTLKVHAILNEIGGKTHDGKSHAPVPTVFGMNFQAVSVGEKLIEKNVGTGGYQDAAGTPSSELLSEIEFADASIGEMTAALKKQGLSDSTVIVITAKHGQSPIDPSRFFPIPGHGGNNGQSPANIIASLLPLSESPNNPTGIGPTEDDVSLLWLSDSHDLGTAISSLEQNAEAAGIGEIFAGSALGLMYNLPGVPPAGDSRTPDIIITPHIGVVYTGSSKKLAEHGGFAHDDTNVMMLVANPGFHAATITSPVETTQVAPTILSVLGLDPNALQAVQKEHTQVLPGLTLPDSD